MTTQHNHAGGHARGTREGDRRRLTLVLVLTLGYAVAEVVGGLASGSLALLADAGHMVSDVAALGLALFAAWLAARTPTAERTYGYYRAEVLTAGVHALTAHAVVAGGRDYADVLRQLRELVRERFGIDHSTIQVEPEGFEEFVTTF